MVDNTVFEKATEQTTFQINLRCLRQQDMASIDKNTQNYSCELLLSSTQRFSLKLKQFELLHTDSKLFLCILSELEVILGIFVGFVGDNTN